MASCSRRGDDYLFFTSRDAMTYAHYGTCLPHFAVGVSSIHSRNWSRKVTYKPWSK